MSMLRSVITRAMWEEDGHLWRLITGVLGAVGAIRLAVGATGGNDTVTWIGGVVVALAFLNSAFLEHSRMDYPIYHRLDELEKTP